MLTTSVVVAAVVAGAGPVLLWAAPLAHPASPPAAATAPPAAAAQPNTLRRVHPRPPDPRAIVRPPFHSGTRTKPRRSAQSSRCLGSERGTTAPAGHLSSTNTVRVPHPGPPPRARPGHTTRQVGNPAHGPKTRASPARVRGQRGRTPEAAARGVQGHRSAGRGGARAPAARPAPPPPLTRPGDRDAALAGGGMMAGGPAIIPPSPPTARPAPPAPPPPLPPVPCGPRPRRL